MKNKNSTGGPGKDSSDKNRLVHEGTVVEPIKNILFHVQLDDNDQIVMGYLSGNMRRKRIRVMLGDRVKVEISNYDCTKGRILCRLPHRESISNSQAQIEQTKDDHQAKKDTTSPESSLDKDTNPNQDLES
uniref:translation initiation factor 1 n=1 Tax=Scleria parvula TaxID=388579 RepID=UPI001F12B9DF|nr:translation initiation factor 1 [Scleria parvula]ULQ67665.1 translation initiation factor 1 [Scleria parvula]